MNSVNDQKTIKEYELLKTYYHRRVKDISEEKFQEIRSELGVNEETYLDIGFLENKNGKIDITVVGMRYVEFFGGQCDKCKKYFLYNAFKPIVCPHCGNEIESKTVTLPTKEEYQKILDDCDKYIESLQK